MSIDIKKIMDDYLSESSAAEKSEVEEKFLYDFEKLSPQRKKTARQMFLDDWDTRMKTGMESISLSIKLMHVSQYVSLAYIADNFFGKSRQWLNNKLKGNLVNGKPAAFTPEEIKKLSAALVEISNEIRATALQITS